MIRQTDRGIAPWYLIEAADHRYRDLTVGRTLLHAIRSRLNHPTEEPPTPATRCCRKPPAPGSPCSTSSISR